MSKLILKSIAESISFDSLPVKWQNFDLITFSREKTLYDFQQEAIKNALKILWKYYDERIDYQEKERIDINLERKKYLFDFYRGDPHYPEEKADYDLTNKEGKKTAKLLEEYYPVVEGRVSFENFINRMNFWMATGSGKTLVIVKLIEILGSLIKQKEIPENDILFLTYRDDLLDQFKEYIKEINSSRRGVYINLKSLKEWDEVKRDNVLFKNGGITVFYYRSDNLWTEQKEKRLDFRNYENFGKWYILLDEAHKGDKEDSIRQIIYSIMSRNGFLFNFSATFVDPRDFLTTVFNYNLPVFIENGYGKRIYLSQEEIKAFKDKTDFTDNEKQKIVLKTLILLSYLKKCAMKIKGENNNFYHLPLLLTLVNSVNTEDADLKLFFREIEKIGQGKIRENIFESAKKELIDSLKQDPKLIFPQGEEIKINEDLLSKITYQDILEDVYNSKSPGSIEVLTIPGNKQEMVFKLKTSERNFALIKIGDISKWIKENFEGYEIIESFDNESVFRQINQDDSDINILMGSRAFYEGWDSNRPNIILYINIGTGKDAKKFVLQSAGRGVRIEPLKNERKRLSFLYNANKIDKEIFERIKNFVFQLETLFIFGTNPKALQETINTFKEVSEAEGYSLREFFVINKKAYELPLFVPVYKSSEHTLADEKETVKYEISKDDWELTKKYLDFIEDDRILLINYEIKPKILEVIRKSFGEKFYDYYKFVEEGGIRKPELILSRIISHFSVIPEEFKDFEKVEKGKFIVHFERIKFGLTDRLQEFLEKLEEIKKIEEKEKDIKELQRKLFETGIKDQDLFSRPFNGIKIKYVPNHYYYPIILSEQKHKIDYLNHIITEENEIKFIKELDNYLANEDNLFNKKFEWWLFSKLDETTDEVYIPWYNPKTNKIERFKPDFIFWLKEKGSNNYYIVFIDPKSTEYAESFRKIDGFVRIFENKTFPHEGFNIKVKLFCFTPKDRAYSEDRYKDYWYDNIHQIVEAI